MYTYVHTYIYIYIYVHISSYDIRLHYSTLKPRRPAGRPASWELRAVLELRVVLARTQRFLAIVIISTSKLLVIPIIGKNVSI